MDEPIWCLKIFLEGNAEVSVRGPQDDLQSVFSTYVDSQWTGSEVVSVKGICDTPDRAPLMVAVKLEHVHGMSLWLDY